MSKIDWYYLHKPLGMFGAALLLSAALAAAGWQYEKVQHQEYQQSLSKLRGTHKRYRNLVKDIDLLDQYRALYTGYKASGLVGKERRLTWVESLETTNEVLRLPTLTYSLHPRENFERPGFELKQGVEVQSSPMDLSIGMMHEEDLFALLEGLRQSIKNLFTVDSCSLTRQSGIERVLDIRATNLFSRCTIRWVTIDAK